MIESKYAKQDPMTYKELKILSKVIFDTTLEIKKNYMGAYLAIHNNIVMYQGMQTVPITVGAHVMPSVCRVGEILWQTNFYGSEGYIQFLRDIRDRVITNIEEPLTEEFRDIVSEISMKANNFDCNTRTLFKFNDEASKSGVALFPEQCILGLDSIKIMLNTCLSLLDELFDTILNITYDRYGLDKAVEIREWLIERIPVIQGMRSNESEYRTSYDDIDITME